MSHRTKQQGFRMDDEYRTFQSCPECDEEFEVVDARYWSRKLAGEKVFPRTRVFCSNACKQAAWRKRKREGLHNVTRKS